MAHPPQRIVLIPRPCVDVDSNAREMAGEGLGGDSNAVREGGDLVELYGILDKRQNSMRKTRAEATNLLLGNDGCQGPTPDARRRSRRR